MESVHEIVKPLDGQSFRLLRWDNNHRDVYLVAAPEEGQKIKGEGNHWHYHLALELTLFTRGEGTRFIGDRIESFGAGDLVLLGENLPHYWHVRGRSAGLSVQWHFPASHPIWMIPELFPLHAGFREAERGIHYDGATARRLVVLLRQLEATREMDRFSIFMQILTTIASAPARDKRYLSSQLFSLKSESRHLTAIQAAIRFILLNFREEINLAQLLEITHMSRPTFSRQFKKHAGKTLTQFVQQVRLAAVCRELSDTDEPIIEIGFKNGFSEVSSFNRVFRREFDCSPSLYRARTRGQVNNTGTGGK
jgi:AraC-like DNA-binding protein